MPDQKALVSWQTKIPLELSSRAIYLLRARSDVGVSIGSGDSFYCHFFEKIFVVYYYFGNGLLARIAFQRFMRFLIFLLFSVRVFGADWVLPVCPQGTQTKLSCTGTLSIGDNPFSDAYQMFDRAQVCTDGNGNYLGTAGSTETKMATPTIQFQFEQKEKKESYQGSVFSIEYDPSTLLGSNAKLLYNGWGGHDSPSSRSLKCSPAQKGDH